MKAFKIVMKVLFWILFTFLVLFTLYFMFANEGYGIDMLKEAFKDGFFVGIKNFFVGMWRGIKFVFKG